jgi:CO/xanthine dehydrogenase Mo-binding subunit
MVRFTREESLMFHPKRHPMKMDYKLACDKDGKLTALRCRIISDTGAYASVGAKVVERAVGHTAGAYSIENIDVEGVALYTNNVPCGAMRGFGVNQSAFALESCVEDLCQQGGFDSWQFRYDNALEEGKKTTTGQVLGSGCGLKETLLAVKDEFQNAKYAGIACGIKSTGVGNGMPDVSNVKIKIKDVDHIEVYHGWTEMGQGVHTMAQQAVCEELGVNPDTVVVINETSAGVETGMTTSSRGTSLVGNAIIEACKKIKADLEGKSLKDIVGKTYKGSWICDWTNSSFKGQIPENPITHFAYGFATQCVILNDDGTIKKVIAAHDAGRVMNPTLFEGQVEGGVHMGLGYAISETCDWKDGYLVSGNFSRLGILKATQTPDIEVIGVESNDPYGPYGAKGIGEIGLVPTAGAVANAYFKYDGKRRYNLPMGKLESKN